MQRGDLAKPVHLRHGEIADADGADLPLLQQRGHRLGGFFDRHRRIGPMHLVDIDDVGAEPAQGILDLLADAPAAGIAEDLPVAPLQPDLGREKNMGTQLAFRDGLADDLLGPAEAISGCRIDEIDPAFDRRANRGDRLAFVGAAPHPAADGPGAQRDPRGLQRRARDLGIFHVVVEERGLVRHGSSFQRGRRGGATASACQIGDGVPGGRLDRRGGRTSCLVSSCRRRRRIRPRCRSCCRRSRPASVRSCSRRGWRKQRPAARPREGAEGQPRWRLAKGLKGQDPWSCRLLYYDPPPIW